MENKLLNIIEKALSLLSITSIIVFFANLPKILESILNFLDKQFTRYFGKIYDFLNIILCVLTLLNSVKKKKKL